MSFTREVQGIRYAPTHWDDTLQRVALRELGDAKRWVEIGLLNDLRPPYIVNTLAEATTPGLLVAGDPIAIPAPSTQAAVSTDADAVYLRDVRLDRGLLVDEAGDLALAGGLDNLRQALGIRIATVPGELQFHPEYGCWVSTLIGTGNGPVAGQMAAFYVRSALRMDERIQDVPRCTADVSGDVVSVNASAAAITGRTLDIQAVV